MENLGKVIKRIRKSKRLNQKKLSDIAGISMFTLSSIEQGRLIGSIPMIKKICDALEINMAYLFIEAIEDDDLPSDKVDDFDSCKDDILSFFDNNRIVDYIIDAKQICGKCICEQCGRKYDPFDSDAEQNYKFCCSACENGY